MGDLTFFRSTQVKWSSSRLELSQTQYVHNLLDKEGMRSGKPLLTPMVTSVKLYPKGSDFPWSYSIQAYYWRPSVFSLWRGCTSHFRLTSMLVHAFFNYKSLVWRETPIDMFPAHQDMVVHHLCFCVSSPTGLHRCVLGWQHRWSSVHRWFCNCLRWQFHFLDLQKAEDCSLFLDRVKI